MTVKSNMVLFPKERMMVFSMISLLIMIFISSLDTSTSAFPLSAETQKKNIDPLRGKNLLTLSSFAYQSNPYICKEQSISSHNKGTVRLYAIKDKESGDEGKDSEKKKRNLITRFISKKILRNDDENKKEKEAEAKNVPQSNKQQIKLDTEMAIAAALAGRDLEEELKESSVTDGLGLSGVFDKISDMRPGSMNSKEKKLPLAAIPDEQKRMKEETKKQKELREKQEREKQKLETEAKNKERERAKIEKERLIQEKKNKELKEKEQRSTGSDRNSKVESDKKDDQKTEKENGKKSSFDPKSMLGGGISNARGFISNTWDSMFSEKYDEEWIVACPKTRISPGEVVPVVVSGIDVLLVASKDAKKLYAIANSCPHLGTPLETGPIQRRPVEAFQYGTPTASTAPQSPDGCEECIVCPLHQTAFALESGEVRGEWCPYPPVIGKVMGAVKPKAKLSTFAVRTRGKNIEIRINSSLEKKQ